MLRKGVVGVIALQLSLGCAPVIASDSGSSYEFLVVDETVSATRKDRENWSGLFPFEEAEYAAAGVSLDDVISGTCGFAEYKFRGISTEAFPASLESGSWKSSRKQIVAIGDTGHYCRLGKHLYERLTLLSVRSWEDILYIVGSADVYFDHDSKAYVVDAYFVEKSMLEDYLVPLPDAGNQRSCYEANWLLPDEKKEFEESGWARYDENICAVYGVYIRDIPSAHKLSNDD